MRVTPHATRSPASCQIARARSPVRLWPAAGGFSGTLPGQAVRATMVRPSIAGEKRVRFLALRVDSGKEGVEMRGLRWAITLILAVVVAGPTWALPNGRPGATADERQL